MTDGAEDRAAGVPGWAGAVQAGRRVLDLLLPPQCLGCGALVDAPGSLCPACWPTVRFIDRPWCAACGLPFEFDVGDGALCAACLRERPEYGRGRAAFVYDADSRGLVLAFKHRDRTDAAPAFARWMARAAGELAAEADVIAPVPLHWTRLFARRYNQAALLARGLGRETGVPVVPDLLVRRKRTPPLGSLGPSARRRRLAGAFRVRPTRRAEVAGRRVLLVDDVQTTGMTARACARALLAAGAAGVDLATLARVVRPSA